MRSHQFEHGVLQPHPLAAGGVEVGGARLAAVVALRKKQAVLAGLRQAGRWNVAVGADGLVQENIQKEIKGSGGDWFGRLAQVARDFQGIRTTSSSLFVVGWVALFGCCCMLVAAASPLPAIPLPSAASAPSGSAAGRGTPTGVVPDEWQL